MPAIQSYSAGESAAKLTLSQNDVAERLLRDLLTYGQKGNDGSCVKRTFLSITRLDFHALTMVNCSVNEEKPGRHL